MIFSLCAKDFLQQSIKIVLVKCIFMVINVQAVTFLFPDLIGFAAIGAGFAMSN
jgi:hypothetical protein